MKLFLCLIMRHSILGRGGIALVFLTRTLNGEWPVSRSGRLASKEGGWVSPTVSQKIIQKTEADYLCPSSTEVKKTWICPIRLSCIVLSSQAQSKIDVSLT
jgi:hypothetical protein